MKKIAILGSTGSIGTQTLDVVRANGDIEVLGISAGRNVKMLEEQAREFHPQLIAVWDENAAKDLAVRLADMDVKIVSGMEGLLELARMPQTDILVTAVVGMIGIRPTMEGIKAGKDIALANKETLVTAGHLIIPMAKEHGVQILPVDSEHSAIFQALHGEKRAYIFLESGFHPPSVPSIPDRTPSPSLSPRRYQSLRLPALFYPPARPHWSAPSSD